MGYPKNMGATQEDVFWPVEKSAEIFLLPGK
jgi:hypothetical protein